MKKPCILVPFFLFCVSGAAHAASLLDGHYSPIIPGAYYDTWIETDMSDEGELIGLTESFDLARLVSIPFRFACDGSNCVNTSNPAWHITIVSPMQYVDNYNGFNTAYGFLEPMPPEKK